MTRIVHLSDLHFGAEDPVIVAALLADIRADPPDLVAISGDLTQNALFQEYHAARTFIDALGVPTLVVPGNHDLTPYWLIERFTAPYARWRALIAPQTEPVWQDAATAVLGIDSTQRMDLHYDWSRGRIGSLRLAALIARLDALPPGLMKVVVTHHPLMRPPAGQDRPVAGGARLALDAFARHGVTLVLAGHLHRAYLLPGGPDGGLPLVLQGSTSTSVRLFGDPNSYARITLTPGSAPVVTLRIWTGAGWAEPRPLPVGTPRPD